MQKIVDFDPIRDYGSLSDGAFRWTEPVDPRNGTGCYVILHESARGGDMAS